MNLLYSYLDLDLEGDDDFERFERWYRSRSDDDLDFLDFLDFFSLEMISRFEDEDMYRSDWESESFFSDFFSSFRR